MMERFASDQNFAARCYHELHMGLDTDHAEAAALHTARMNEMVTQFLTKRDGD